VQRRSWRLELRLEVLELHDAIGESRMLASSDRRETASTRLMSGALEERCECVAAGSPLAPASSATRPSAPDIVAPLIATADVVFQTA